MNDLIVAKDKLQQNGYTCVLCKGEEIVFSLDRGVKPLVAFIESKKDFVGFCCADKVVGKEPRFCMFCSA